jgi:hypothetical protein
MRFKRGWLTMPPPSFSIAATSPASWFKKTLSSKETFLISDAVFVFLCGGTRSISKPQPLRDILIQYARKHFSGFRFFRAEDVFDALKERRNTDLLTLENQIGDYSDCIIIICESEGAFAELGAFALSDKLVKQILVVNDEKYKDSRSFITDGPIARANEKSKFKPAVYANFETVLKSAIDIQTKLQLIQRTYRRRIPLTTAIDFKAAKPKERLLFLADLIHFFCPLTSSDLANLLQLFYGQDICDLHFDLALMVSLGFIEKLDTHWFRFGLNEATFFYDYDRLEPTALRGSIVRQYFQNDRDRLKYLRPQPK